MKPTGASLWCGTRAGLSVTVRTALAVPKRVSVLEGGPALGTVASCCTAPAAAPTTPTCSPIYCTTP